MHGEGTGFDVEVASSREAEHVLTLGIPGHAVGIWFLRDRDSEDPMTTTLALGTIPALSQALFLKPEAH